MKRFHGIGVLVAAVICSSLAAGGFVASATPVAASAPAPATRPNVVLFLTDDMRVDDLKYMPKTRSILGDAGVTFTRSYSPNPLCCPARAELLTAQYSHNNGVHSNNGQWGGIQALQDPNNNIGVWLQNAGYHTAWVGKYINQYEFVHQTIGVPDGWTRFDATVTDPAIGVNHVYSYTKYEFKSYKRPEILNYTNIGLDDEGRPYLTRAMTSIMQGYVDEFSGDKPFFIVDSILAPHDTKDEDGGPPVPEPKYADLYPTEINQATKSKAYMDQDMRDVPEEARPGDPTGHVKAREARAQQFFLARIRTLASVDDQVEAVVDRLKATGEYDNTVFMFTSDNGYMLGEHNHQFKYLAYRESLSVPLIVAGPGFPVGVTSSFPVTTVDVAQTILDLGGATPGRLTDGVSFVGRTGEAEARPLPIEGEVHKEMYQHEWGWQGSEWGRYTYVKYWNGGEELYDTVRSPWQEENLLKNARYAGVLTQMRSLYDSLRVCQGTSACNPPSAVPPDPYGQLSPVFSPPDLNTRSVRGSGHGKFTIRLQVINPAYPARAVDAGSVRMQANGRGVGAWVPVGQHGWATVKWDPGGRNAGKSFTLAVRYDGGHPDVRAAVSRQVAKVHVTH